MTQSEDGSRIRALITGTGRYVPDDVWTALPKNVATLRDKTVVRFDRDKVTRLDVESPQGPVTLVRENDKWK